MNKCKEEKAEEQMLNKHLQEATLNVLRERIEELYEEKVKGIIVRCRAHWHEHGEKACSETSSEWSDCN